MRRPSRFGWGLAAIGMFALALRAAYVHWFETHGVPVVGDALRFHQVAQGLADGHGFRELAPYHGPTAEHPPGLELFLAIPDLLGKNGYPSHRLALSGVGTVTVVLIGLLGRRVAGAPVGLVAAGLAAIYPMLWTADASLMSETLYGVFVVGSLLAALGLRDKPSWRRAALLGALIGLSALTRGEGLALVLLLALPAAWSAAGDRSGRLRLGAAALVATFCVVAPWTIYNTARFDQFVLISTNSDGVFVGSNCAPVYFGPYIGTWRYYCYGPRKPGENEAVYLHRQRGIGIDYALNHVDRWPAVVAARLGRLFDVYKYGQSIYLNAAEGRPPEPVKIGLRMYWAILALAIAGVVLLFRRRRRAELATLLAPVVMVVLVAIVTYGGTRFRFAAEPSFVVLAAVTLVAAFTAVRRRFSAGEPG